MKHNDCSSAPAQLFERTMAFLTAPQVPALFRAFDQLGIGTGSIAKLLDIERGVVARWRCGQHSLTDQQRVTLVAHLLVLLRWLFGAEGQLGTNGSRLEYWRQRTEAARQLLEIELRATPQMAERAHSLADNLDAELRPAAIRLAVRWCTPTNLEVPPKRAASQQPQPARAARPRVQGASSPDRNGSHHAGAAETRVAGEST